MTWSREFNPPVPGFRTLRDAANHITKLPKAEQQKDHWQTAGQFLINAAERSEAWVMMAAIAMNKALNFDKVDEVAPRRKAARKYRIVK